MTFVQINIGVAESENAVGNEFRYGLGREPDLKEAVRWYIRSANHGYAYAWNNLGYMYCHGHGVPKNSNFAREWFKKAAEAGVPEAMLNYGAELLVST